MNWKRPSTAAASTAACNVTTIRTAGILPATRATRAPLLLIGLIALFYVLTIRAGHDWGGDFALYIQHAQNLVHGIPYADTGYIYNPYYPSLSPRFYPPLFPLLLAPVVALFGLNLTALKLVVIFFFALFLLVLYLGLRDRLPARYTLALLALVGLNPYLWNFKDDIRAEFPFLFFAYLALLLMRHHAAIEEQQPSAGSRRHLFAGILTGLAIYLAFATRTVGLVLLPALLLQELLARRRLSAYALAALTAFALPALLQTLLLPASGYGDQLALDLPLVLENLAAYLITTFTFFDNGYSNALLFLLGTAGLSLSAAGYLACLRRRPTVYEWFLPLYLAALLAWPTYEGPRFLVPILPLIFFYLLVGVLRLSENLPRPRLRPLLPAFLLLALLLSYATKYTTLPFGRLDEGIATPAARDLFAFVRAETAADAVFIFRKPRVLTLLTGRPAAIYNQEEHLEQMWSYWEQIGAGYLITKETDESYWLTYVQANSARLNLVYHTGDFRVFALTHGD